MPRDQPGVTVFSGPSFSGEAGRQELILSVCLPACLQGLEGEDEGAISMLSDNTAKLTSAVRYRTQHSNV